MNNINNVCVLSERNNNNNKRFMYCFCNIFLNSTTNVAVNRVVNEKLDHLVC